MVASSIVMERLAITTSHLGWNYSVVNQVGIFRGGLDFAMRLIVEERRKMLYLVEVLSSLSWSIL